MKLIYCDGNIFIFFFVTNYFCFVLYDFWPCCKEKMIGLCLESGNDISFHKNDDLSSLKRLYAVTRKYLFFSPLIAYRIKFDIEVEGDQSATSLSLWSGTSQNPNTGVKITVENNSFSKTVGFSYFFKSVIFLKHLIFSAFS